MAIVDFLYRGEANVFQENLDSFLEIAEELQLKGLIRKTDEKVEKSLSSKFSLEKIQKLLLTGRHSTEISTILEKMEHWPFLETIQWTLRNLKTR